MHLTIFSDIFSMEPPKEHIRKFNITVLPPPLTFVWNSPFNKEKEVSISSAELGDGATSRVYLGTMNDKTVAIKKFKGYSCNQGAVFVKAYEKFASMQSHPKIATLFGLCPNTGFIVLEFCEKQIGDHKIHTLEDLMRLYDADEIPMDLKILALTDIIEGVEFLHHHNIIHRDIKPSSILVNSIGDDEFEFKLTDYAGTTLTMHESSHSITLKQLMTPGYMAPELYPISVNSAHVHVQPSKAFDICICSIEL